MESLSQLNNAEQTELLDSIDRLRRKGLCKYDIDLPQLIVVGDQSAGKSSVLEGLTRLKFPSKDQHCTSFATEVILRRSTEASARIECSIIPAQGRTDSRKTRLSKFERSYATKEDLDLPLLMDEAKEFMKNDTKSAVKFFEDVLSIKYSAPDVPSLTIVDLPGIIHSRTDRQSKNDIALVESLVKSYMRNKKAVILAVIAATANLENQAVLSWAQQDDIDPGRQRTLGIITKLDRLEKGTEQPFVQLARNETVKLNLKWHMVKNRGGSEEDQAQSDTERDKSEMEFFSKSPWGSFSAEQIGIDSLRKRLSDVLLNQIRQQLPSLLKEVESALNETKSDLDELGESRETKKKQRSYLVSKAETFARLTENALNGIYNNDFFSHPDAKLRAHINDLHRAFSEVMRAKGHSWNLHDHPGYGRTPLSSAYEEYDGLFEEPTGMPRESFINNIVKPIIYENHSSAFPLPNPQAVSEVFRQQSYKWKDIGQLHVMKVQQAVHSYISACLNQHMDSDCANAIMTDVVEPALEEKTDVLQTKLADILRCNPNQDPIMFERGFESEYETLRVQRAEKPRFQRAGLNDNKSLVEEDILDLARIYYDRAITTFIHNVVLLVLENTLIEDLSSIFSVSLVCEMDKKKLEAIVGESGERKMRRTELTEKLEDLKSTRAILQSQRNKAANVIRAVPKTQVTPKTAELKSHRPIVEARHNGAYESTEKIGDSSPENSEYDSEDNGSKSPATPLTVYESTPTATARQPRSSRRVPEGYFGRAEASSPSKQPAMAPQKPFLEPSPLLQSAFPTSANPPRRSLNLVRHDTDLSTDGEL